MLFCTRICRVSLLGEEEFLAVKSNFPRMVGTRITMNGVLITSRSSPIRNIAIDCELLSNYLKTVAEP